MSRHAGVVRDAGGLRALLRMLEQAPPGGDGLDLATAEATRAIRYADRSTSLLLKKGIEAQKGIETALCHRITGTDWEKSW